MARQLETNPGQGGGGPRASSEEVVKGCRADFDDSTVATKSGEKNGAKAHDKSSAALRLCCGNALQSGWLPGTPPPPSSGDALVAAAASLVDLGQKRLRTVNGVPCEGVGTSGGDPEDTACEGRSAGRQYLKAKRASPACELADEESSDDTDVNNDGKEQGRSKRQRLQWNEELIKRFENAVNHLGVKNAVPKTILQLMNVEGMTRENVASRLQKYRQSLKKLEAASISPPVSTSSAELQRMQESRNQYEAHQQTMAGLASCVVRPVLLPPPARLELAPPLPLYPLPNIVEGIPVADVHPINGAWLGFPSVFPGFLGLPQDSSLLEGFSYPEYLPWMAHSSSHRPCTNVKKDGTSGCSTDTNADTSASELHGKATAQGTAEDLHPTEETETHSPHEDVW